MADEAAPAKAKAAKAKPAGQISLEQAAQLLKCTPQWVMKLARDGFIKKPYTVVSVIHGFVDYKADEERRTTKTAGASRVQDARTEEIELRLYEKSGALIAQAREEGLAVIDHYAGGLRSDLLSIPARVTKDLALRRRIESEINGAFGAASKRIADDVAGASAPAAALDRARGSAPARVGKAKPHVSKNSGRTRAS